MKFSITIEKEMERHSKTHYRHTQYTHRERGRHKAGGPAVHRSAGGGVRVKWDVSGKQ